jgi:hypothetical protein
MKESDFHANITDDYISVEQEGAGREEVRWADIIAIDMVTTDKGPFEPDVWLVLRTDSLSCRLPQGAPDYDAVYDRVSAFPGFSFDNVIQAMMSTGNATFELWRKE